MTDRQRVPGSSGEASLEAAKPLAERRELGRLERMPSTPAGVLALQRAGGNAAVTALMNNRRPDAGSLGRAAVSGRTLQRMWHLDWAALSEAQKTERNTVHAAEPQKKWPSTTKGALNKQLQDGLTLAQTTPDAAPNPVPAWLDTQVPKKDIGGNPTSETKDLYKPGDKKKYKNIWGLVHNNTEGLLPGLKGAGGYQEYYAEPEGGARANFDAGGRPFGRNRVLKQTNAATTYWWATNDHYTNISFVEDA